MSDQGNRHESPVAHGVPFVTPGLDDWGFTVGVTSAELTAVRAAVDALGVDHGMIAAAARLTPRVSRRLALCELLWRIDSARPGAEKLAFREVDGEAREYSRAKAWFNRVVAGLRAEVDGHLDSAREIPWRESLPQCSRDDLEAAIESLEALEESLPAGDWLADSPGLAHPGLCAWWVDSSGASQLSRGLGPGLAVLPDLIYLGQVGATEWPSGRRRCMTLAESVLERDLQGPVRLSDLRWSLAALLLDGLDLCVRRSMLLTSRSEEALTEWMKLHLRVAMWPVKDPDTLADVARHVQSALLDPPLNLDRRPSTALRTRLVEMRRQISLEGVSGWRSTRSQRPGWRR